MQEPTATIRDEMKARRSDPHLDAILSSMDEGVYEIDVDGRLIYMNAACERILGYRLEDCYGTDMHSLVHRDQSGKVIPHEDCRISGVMRDGKPYRSHDVTLLRANGQSLSVNVASSPLIVNGEVIGAVVCFHDNTLRKQAEAHERMLLMMQQREDFMSTLAHDLKTPILAGDRILSLLLEGNCSQLPPIACELLGKLKQSNLAMLQMVQNLLAVYRYESGVEELRLETFDVPGLVEECVSEIRSLAENKRIKLVVDAPDELQLEADSLAVRRVVSNLLSNAIKFTNGGGSIRVLAEERNGELTLEVSDTGIGITFQEIDIFDRFRMGADGRQNRSIGSGLGLHLCKRIVDAHGGSIGYRSEPGSGTTFTVTLPRVINEIPARREIQPCGAPGRE